MSKSNKTLTTIGTMSGTSFDGLDASLVVTNGDKIISLGKNFSISYPELFRQNIRRIIYGDYDSKLLLDVEDEITIYHAKAVSKLLKEANLSKEQVDLIGFHGQTIFHDARACKTWQLGNPSLLAELTGINVVADFRRRDMANGGEGAPLVPLFHAALFKNTQHPTIIVNIGGVANITYLDPEGNIIAFDTGPGCALIDDWVNSRLQLKYDNEGSIAASGAVNHKRLELLMNNNYFHRKPPKSLDRNQFIGSLRKVSSLNAADGAATLTHFTAKTITAALEFLPKTPKKWIVSGGGRHNKYLMRVLAEDYNLPVQNIDELKFKETQLNGDFVESQAFGFLAARAYLRMPLSLPTTTGVIKPVSGGGFYSA
jgi:anhydro-N-acetylmuramic acid kinase